MASCWKCNKNLGVTGPTCTISGCPWRQYDAFVKATAESRVFVFGEDHKSMGDVPYIEGLLTCLAAKRKCVFLFELLPSCAPDNLLYTQPIFVGGGGGSQIDARNTDILYPLDEREVEEDQIKYGCAWSGTAAAKGIVVQVPFVNENFTLQPCFYNLCQQASPQKFDTTADLPSGDHTRNNMLLKVASENNVETFGIDLPGKDLSLMKPDNLGARDDPLTLQRFDIWNMLRDTWMSLMIAKVVREQEPQVAICVFVGADHNPGIECGNRQIQFRFKNKTGQREPRVVTLKNFFCLNQANFENPVIYLEPQSYSNEQRVFKLGQEPNTQGKWKY